jgi:hypothetical protein
LILFAFGSNEVLMDFDLDMFDALYEDEQLRNNTPSNKRTICDEDNARFAKELRAVCEEFGGRMLLGEIFGSHQHQREFLGKEKNDGIMLSFNFEMLRMRFSPHYFSKLITTLNNDFPKPFSPVFTFSNHDRRRNLRTIKRRYREVQNCAVHSVHNPLRCLVFTMVKK